MNFIIAAEVVNPPTQPLPFRDVTGVARCDLKLSVLLETEKEEKDMYWYFMKPRGMLDYIDYIITREEKESGFRMNLEDITISNERVIISTLKRRILPFQHPPI